MDWIKLDNARDLRDFLNGIPAKELDVIYIKTLDGAVMNGLRLRPSKLTDGSDVMDYTITYNGA